MLLLFVACDLGSFNGEEGQVRVTDEDFVVGAISGYSSGDPVLQGETLCPEFGCVGCEAESTDFADCYEVFSEHLAPDGACYGFDTLGTAELDFVKLDCEARPDHTDDTVRFEVVETATPRLEYPYAEAALDEEADGVLRHHELDSFPEDVLPGSLQVLEGHSAHAYVVLEDADGALVAYTRSEHELGVEGGELLGVDDRNGLYVKPDGEGQILFDDEPAGSFSTVAEEEVVSLEVHVGVIVGDGDDEVPFVARAIARDAEGEQVFGVPVEWSLEGTPLVVAGTVDEEFGFEDNQTVFLSDECVAGDGLERSTILTASWNGLEASADVSWISAIDEGEFEADEDCLELEGCAGGCASGPAIPGLAALLLGLAATRRRRR